MCIRDRVHAAQLKEEFLRALMAGTLAGELSPLARESEEAFLAAMFQNLGRLLTEYYFPEEAVQIRQQVARNDSTGTREVASRRILGIGLQDLGLGVAKAWGLPESLQQALDVYKRQVVYLITLMQSLGLLVVHYHFPDEALQIHRLMQPAPSPREGEPEEPGMSEESAAFAVLGVDIETIGIAVARHWGLDDAVVHMIRHHPLSTPVRSVESDDDMLRTVASCAHEAVQAAALPGTRAGPALQRVVQRYGRALHLSLRDLQAALLGQPPGSVPPTQPMPCLLYTSRCV